MKKILLVLFAFISLNAFAQLGAHRRCVRDWSGILLETEAGDGGGSEGEKRYSGKPDGDSRNAQKKLFREDSCGFVDVVNLNSRYLNS